MPREFGDVMLGGAGVALENESVAAACGEEAAAPCHGAYTIAVAC